jgi:hypothetical protein
MISLSPRQIDAIALRIIGDVSSDDNEPVFKYRTHNDISRFFDFARLSQFDLDGLSRPNRAAELVLGCQNEGARGASGLSEHLERLLVSLLDSGEFDSPELHRAAVDEINDILDAHPIRVTIHPDRSVEVIATTVSAQQRVLDEQIHTVFGKVLKNSDLGAARAHFGKAQKFLRGSSPDFENAAKEAVASLESIVLTLIDERDFTSAIKKASKTGYIPKPLDDIAIKLFAYRGNEPGVAHGHAAMPNVHADEAQLVINLVGSLGTYLVSRLRQSTPA